MLVLIALASLAQDAAPRQLHAPRYSIRRIAPLEGHAGSFATDLDEDGRVVGTSGGAVAFFWEDGESRALAEAAPGLPTRAEGLGPGGSVVGSATVPWTETAALWTLSAGVAAAPVPLGCAPGDRQSVSYAIDAHGVAVGCTDDTVFARPAAFDTKGRSVAVLPMRVDDVSGVAHDVNDLGVAVGHTASLGPTQACRWQRTGEAWSYAPLPSLVAGAPSEARAVHADGLIAGHSMGPDGRWALVVWSGSEAVRLGGAAPYDAFARDVGAGGEVVGFVIDVATLERRAVLHPGADAPSAAPIDLSRALPLSSRWSVLREATAVNSRGAIVGFGEVDGGTHAFLLTPIRRVLRLDAAPDGGPLRLRVRGCAPGAEVELYAGRAGGETALAGVLQSLDIEAAHLAHRAVAGIDGVAELALPSPASGYRWLQALDRTAGEVSQVVSVPRRPRAAAPARR